MAGRCLVLSALFLTFAVITKCQDFKLCAKPGLSNACQQLSRNLTYSCVENFHSVDCLLNIDNGKTSFGLITAEEAVLAAPLTSNIVVIGEKHGLTRADDPLQTVVIVKYNHDDGLNNLKGFGFCHPGFKFEGIVTPLVLQEFEKKALEASAVNVCTDTNTTVIEKYVKALAEFFGPSCRPGPWTTDVDLDRTLKSSYPSLCALCTSGSCDVTTNDPFADALTCLETTNADVALSTYENALRFFNKTENVNRYKYLCTDGVASAPDMPCVWTRQLPDVIVANRNEAETVTSTLQTWLKDYEFAPDLTPYIRGISGSMSVNLLLTILNINGQTDRLNFTAPIDLKTYVAEFRPIPDSKNALCNTNIKWCTTSDGENRKCAWLAQASLNRDIQPVLSCVRSSSPLDCLSDVQNNIADIATIDANYGYIGKRKNLVAVAFPETVREDLKVILTVVKDNSTIERFENLKDKTACFPEYGGIEWLTFIDTGRIRRVLPKDTCDYGVLISDFVGSSCVPGALQDDHEVTSHTDTAKLCEMCQHSNSNLVPVHKNCNADDTNFYFGNEGALQCLKEVGDFAVVTRQDFPNVYTDAFRVLCKNGSLASHTGLNVDTDCALAVITTSEVVTRRMSSKIPDIKVVLQEYEEWFGVSMFKPFELFNEFNGTKDLLFLDSTPGLDIGTSSNPYVQNYVTLFSHIDQCSAEDKSSSASNLHVLVVLLVSTVFAHRML